MIPILAALAGLASAVGIGGGAYALGTTIKDRNSANNAKKQRDLANSRPNKVPGNSAKDRFLGTGNSVSQFQNLTPNQQAAQDVVLKHALSQLGSNQYDFGPIENISQQNFQRHTIPSIMARFGNQGGSDINNSIASAGVDLNQQLAALRSKHALGQQGLNQGLLKLGLKPQFENAFFPGQEGLLEKFGSKFSNKEDLADFATYLQDLWNNRKGKSLSPYENEYQTPEYGEFAQNKALKDFVNQGTNPSNKNIYALENVYGYNKPQSPSQVPNPKSNTPTVDTLRALYPNSGI